jgi:hypothetical protein
MKLGNHVCGWRLLKYGALRETTGLSYGIDTCGVLTLMLQAGRFSHELIRGFPSH